MKKLLIVFVAFVLASCATTKTSKVEITPEGNWDYSITGTPEGDFNGVMNVTTLDKTYSAKLNASGSELPIENFAYEKESKKVTGELYYSGTPVAFDAILSGDEMTGSMSAGGMSFPFKATRKK
jgi:hypothetical protein